MDVTRASERCVSVLNEVGTAVIARPSFLETVLAGVLARGHVLIEDVPGTGKTLTARSLAKALGLSFSRIQFTPDLLPTDVTGTYVFNEQNREFEFREGPVFANIVLADEINRAPPKTQAALLEAMEEKQVTVDGETIDLPEPFFVIATQNPVEQEGTFPLPEAQVDRFVVKTEMGYPNREGEMELVDRRLARESQTPSVGTVLEEGSVSELQMVPEKVEVDPDIRGYIVDLARETRRHPNVEVGVSPRGIQRFVEATRAVAVINGRDYVAPDDVKDTAVPAMAHRIVLTAEAKVKSVNKKDVINQVLGQVKVPTLN